MLSSTAVYFAVFIVITLVAVITVHHFNIDSTKLILLTLVSIFFPLNLQFLGRDAVTTGGILILVSYALFVVQSLKDRTPIVRNNDWLLYTLIILGAVSNGLAIEYGDVAVEDIGPIMRQYFSFTTSLLFFMVVKNVVQNLGLKDRSSAVAMIQKLFSFLVVLTAAHVVISMLNKYLPFTNDWVAFFYPKEAEALAPEGQDRIRSFVFGYEYYAEMLAALTPLAIYKIATTRNPCWFACLAIFSYGVFLSVTRSGIMLFIVGLALSVLYQFRRKVVAGAVVISALAGILMIFVMVYPQGIDEVMDRFSMAGDVYVSGGSIFDTINRGNFPEIWDQVNSELNLYGHSMLRIDFHNLFLTTLHQMGVVGAFLFFLALLYPPVLLVKSFLGDRTNDKPLTFACLLFVSVFLINETKVEFTRSASYSQLCWIMFALCFLVSKLTEKQPGGAEMTWEKRRAVRTEVKGMVVNHGEP